jgi:hypothetical protein
MRKFFLLFIFTLFALFYCTDKTVTSTKKVSAEFFTSGPQLVKIPVNENTNIDSLINTGMEIIVVEKNYIIARLDQSEAENMESMSINMETFQESELVQRLIRIIVNQKSDIENLNNIDIDIWEVKGDTVIAQAFDIHIRQIEKLNYDVAIIESDIHNLAGKSDQN